MTDRSRFPSIARRLFVALVLIGGGYILGQTTGEPNRAQAEIRETARRQAFQSGDERSASTLKEIATTLKRMDQRIERIESVVTKDASK